MQIYRVAVSSVNSDTIFSAHDREALTALKY